MASLVVSDAKSVHRAGVSVFGRCVSENDVPEEAWVDHIQES